MQIAKMQEVLKEAGIDKYDIEIVAEDADAVVRINGEPFLADLEEQPHGPRDCQIAAFAFLAGWKSAIRKVQDLVLELAEGADPDFLEEILENTGISSDVREELGL